MYRYKIILSWSEEDAVYVAEAPELPSCMADGRTYQEALSNVERIIQEWIVTAKELGRPIPDPKNRSAPRQLGGAIGKLTIVEDDEAHLEDFQEYMP